MDSYFSKMVAIIKDSFFKIKFMDLEHTNGKE